MMELMQIRFSFLCRTNRENIEGKLPIILRISYRKERRDVFTGLYCIKNSWDSLNGKVKREIKDSLTINKNLELIHRKANQVFEELMYSGEPFSMDELVNKLKGKDEKPELLVDYLRKRNEEIKLRAGLDISHATYEKYERSLRHMIDFLQSSFKVKNYLLLKIDTAFLEKYFYYLRTEKKIGNNSSVKYMTSLKTILMPVIEAGIIKPDPFKGLRIKMKTIDVGFLTDEEIELLKQVELQSQALERIRDQYLFCCYTGLAYVDLQQLNKSHFISQKEDEFYIIKPRQKTGQRSVIPLIPAAKNILQKYSLTSDFRDFIWKVSTNQKMNLRLKTIGETAKLAKPLHMHLARHTFATTITLSNGVPLESVSAMLGHASLAQTQHYAKIVALKIINDMAKVKLLYK